MSGPAVTVPRLHVVTDDEVLGRPDFLDRARTVLAAGPSVALHLRGPRTGGRRLWELAHRLRPGRPGTGVVDQPACASRALVLVNDRVDVARLVGADGVHLSERSLPVTQARTLLPEGTLVGVSVHGTADAVVAAEAGADYLIVGTIFETPTHPGRSAAGPGLLRAVASSASPPLVAIGGVDPARVVACLDAGAHGVAVLRGVWDAGDTERAVSGYLEALGLVPRGVSSP